MHTQLFGYNKQNALLPLSNFLRPILNCAEPIRLITYLRKLYVQM